MTHKNSLLEWINQTKKMTKAVDYAGMDAIDDIVNLIWFIEPNILKIHADFINFFCDKYHKPNPLKFVKNKKRILDVFREKLDENPRQLISQNFKKSGCSKINKWSDCALANWMRHWLSQYIDHSLQRIEKLLLEIQWQWFEIIDFMFERPELINPAAIDEYVEDKINEVCEKHKKNNPFKNGTAKRFGKYWKDENGKWRTERRKRF